MKDICYNKNYLTEVVARIDFAKPVEVLKEQVLPKDVQEIIKKRYPIYEPSKGIFQGVAINDQGVTSNREEFSQWVYHGEEREKNITVSSRFISVSLRRYQDYRDFKVDIIDPISQIMSIEKDIQVQRTGLRFINIYTDLLKETNDFQKYFSSMIACPFTWLIDSGSCSRSFLITEYLLGEVKLRLQTGIFNPDYPARIKKKDFILDIDAYVDTPHVVSDTSGFFDELHLKIQEKFEACITDDLRGVLNEQ